MQDDALPDSFSFGRAVGQLAFGRRRRDPPASTRHRADQVSVGPAKTDRPEMAHTRRTVALAAAVSAVVLYIEDHPVNLKLMHGVFALWPHLHLESERSGGAGLGRIRTEKPDLVLIDGNVIDLDGIDILLRIRSDPPTKNLPVVVISSDARPARAVELLALGADEYLVKPFDFAHLRDVVVRLAHPRIAPEPVTRSPHQLSRPPQPGVRGDHGPPRQAARGRRLSATKQHSPPRPVGP